MYQDKSLNNQSNQEIQNLTKFILNFKYKMKSFQFIKFIHKNHLSNQNNYYFLQKL